ncbi:MAG: hypothetical protein F6K10_22220, partial [Moorea sp. SIO2B7]|nr:hypothetical protein [Moorena sp. SIO2B7]
MTNGSEEMGIGQEFQDPPEIQQDREEEFEEEATVPSESGEEPLAAEDEEEQYLEFDESLLQVKSDIENQLSQLSYDEAGVVQAEDVFEGASNIVGVGLGTGEDNPSLGLEPGAAAINVYVAEPVSVDEVKSVLVDSMGIAAASSDDVPINVIVSGIIEAQTHRFRMRPAPGGVSVGHYRVTAGTLGCLARGRRAPRNRRLLMLSNNHVLANSNNARFSDSIIQPDRT